MTPQQEVQAIDREIARLQAERELLLQGAKEKHEHQTDIDEHGHGPGAAGRTANPWVFAIEFERCEKPEEG